MTERTKKFTPQHERTLLDPQARPVDRASAISCMSVDGLVLHEELIVSLVDHTSPHLRAAALKILLRWGRAEYIPFALDRVKSDSEKIVRREIAAALTLVADGEHFDRIVRVLVESIENDPDPHVAVTAYKAARVLLVSEGWLTNHIDHREFDRQHDVDWKLLAPYRGPAKSSQSSN